MNDPVRIIATVGPASSSTARLQAMARAGLDIVRVNFSHGALEDHAAVLARVRALNAGKGRSRLMVLGDLEGYRIRVGELPAPMTLRQGQRVLLAHGTLARGPAGIPFDYDGDPVLVRPGVMIFIDDGNIALRALRSDRRGVAAEVVVPGTLKSRKGINIPGVRFPFSGLTARDRECLEFAVAQRMDYVAQSFVRTRRDILAFRDSVKDRLPRCRIIAKIENREGIRNIDSIMAVSDGIMIARGDMGVSLPIHEIAVIQKQIIRKCNRAGKFVITATQMLESMTEHPRPTRAEVTDVANAYLDGSDALMLSAETAVGKYPVEAVAMMDRIVRYTRAHRRGLGGCK